jgi:hypothetical protein
MSGRRLSWDISPAPQIFQRFRECRKGGERVENERLCVFVGPEKKERRGQRVGGGEVKGINI